MKNKMVYEVRNAVEVVEDGELIDHEYHLIKTCTAEESVTKYLASRKYPYQYAVRVRELGEHKWDADVNVWWVGGENWLEGDRDEHYPFND